MYDFQLLPAILKLQKFRSYVKSTLNKRVHFEATAKTQEDDMCS